MHCNSVAHHLVAWPSASDLPRPSLARARRLLVGQVRATSRFRAIPESLLILLEACFEIFLGWGAKERERRAQAFERTLYMLREPFGPTRAVRT